MSCQPRCDVTPVQTRGDKALIKASFVTPAFFFPTNKHTVRSTYCERENGQGSNYPDPIIKSALPQVTGESAGSEQITGAMSKNRGRRYARAAGS